MNAVNEQLQPLCYTATNYGVLDMQMQCNPVKKYEITYSAGGRLFITTQDAMDSIDAKRRFKRRLGFKVINVKAV